MTGPNDSLFVADGWEFTRRCPPGASVAIDLDKDALIDEISARSPGRPGKPLLVTQKLSINTVERMRLNSAVADLAKARAPGSQVQAARHVEADLLGIVADMLLRRSAVLRTRHTGKVRISDIEGWIDANLDRSITAGQLCRIGGVSKRGLEKIFESRRGMSPMRFVTERRLAAAQRMLGAAVPGDDVTSVAIGLGFNHAGRFSALYRHTYGELPSQTLKRNVQRRA